MGSFSEREKSCEMSFQNCMPFWHAYTSGRETPILFTTNKDMSLAMNIIAQAAFEFTGKVIIISFEVMNNHFHFVLSAEQSYAVQMLSFILKRVKRAFGINYEIKATLKPIEDLASMRNNIVYVHRNGYVANPNHTPFSYPWGTGAYYFMPERHGKPFSKITSVENRTMFRSRDVKLPSDWKVIDNYISPSSFCKTRFGMAMFRDAHHYFSMISKNIEAYSNIAVDLDDEEFLTDQELFSQLQKIVREKYRLGSMRNLSNAQKLDLARTLHFDYRSSNGQIRRVLNLNEYEINNLFPLSKK